MQNNNTGKNSLKFLIWLINTGQNAKIFFEGSKNCINLKYSTNKYISFK